ncbi:conserved hypothetical protein [Alteromonas sp. 38]|uniref:hypothetical protein n=1 Tax=unclassified Alteromonas TaxID=2614992 RepID=UPI0012F4742B|nr:MULTISPECIES: hypothetical protein [unclassified Alteromonas]CAD5272655.1 conserved hypothetical protein [Alteromonas sp. 154]VXB53210.1 conserved hypothetical protein [Alteromonas sp. 38]
MDNTKKRQAVITGDIANSQQLSDTDLAHVLQVLTNELKAQSALFNGQYDVFRGDAFQVVIPEPESAMLVAICIRLALKACTPTTDVRISVGIGGVSFTDGKVKTGNGDAFVRSGRTLDSMKSQFLAFSSDNEAFNKHASLLTAFVDSHMTSLTQTQSETLLAYIKAKDKGHESIANTLGKTRSNITRILIASQYHLVSDYLHYMATEVKTEQ